MNRELIPAPLQVMHTEDAFAAKKYLYRNRLRSVRKGARVAARALPATAESHSRMECALLGAAMLAIVALPRLTRLGRIVKSVHLYQVGFN